MAKIIKCGKAACQNRHSSGQCSLEFVSIDENGVCNGWNKFIRHQMNSRYTYSPVEVSDVTEEKELVKNEQVDEGRNDSESQNDVPVDESTESSSEEKCE